MSDLDIFSAKQLSSLHGYNILTAETFIGICASTEGFSGVARILDISGQHLNELIGQVKAKLSPELVDLLSKPNPNEYALGVREPGNEPEHQPNKKEKSRQFFKIEFGQETNKGEKVKKERKKKR